MPAPAAILRGIDDNSTRQIPYIQSPLAQHTPLLMLMTKRGPVEPLFLGSDGFNIFYDLDSIEVNSKWHSHQSVLADIAIRVGNATMVVKRIVDENSKTATICIGANAEGTSVKTMQAENIEEAILTGTIVPVFEFATANPGDWGNRVGIQIYKASNKKQNIMGVQLDAVIYEAVVVMENETSGQHRVINNIYGEPSTSFTMKRDSIYNNVDYFFDTIMSNSYIQDIDKISRQQYFSMFKLHVESASELAVNPDEYWKEDIISNLVSDGTNVFRMGAPIFAMGGDDGFHNYSESLVENRLDKMRRYEEATKLWLDSIDDTNPITDMAQFPYGIVWDSGFTKETKMGFLNILQYRKDVCISMASTSVNRYYQDDNDDTIFDYQSKLTNQETISLGMYYRSIFSGIPESIAFGTPTVRVTLVGQDGINRNSTYRKRQTINNDLFEKVARYCGSGTGEWDSNYAFDQGDLNVLDNWHDVSMDYLSPPVTDDAWDAGLIYVQNKDTKRKFYPTYQTLYPDDTSVLNNIFTMLACCWIEKQHFKGWTMITGDSKSTNLEIAEKLDQYLNTALMDVFDKRFITESKTYYTESDTATGFSFTTDTTIYSNMSKHTASYKISAYRMSDIL